MAKRKTAAQRRFDDNALLFTTLGLIFKQLYEDYAAKPIEEIAETTSGGTPLRSIKSYYGGEIPWIKSGELNDGLITQAEEFITQEGLENSSAKIFPKGTLVVALYGATVGKTGILDISAASNQAVCAITTNTKDITNKFLYWFFRYKRPEFLGASFGGAQPNISQKIIRETNIPIPPIELQKNLSDFFSAAEQKQKKQEVDYPPLPEKFTNTLRIVTRVEVIADRIAKAQSLREKADTEADAILLSALFHTFDINSQHWKSMPMPEAIEINDRQVDPKLPEYSKLPHISGENMESNTCRLLPYRTAEQDSVRSSNYFFSPNTILYSKIRPYLRKAVYVDFQGVCSADVYPIKVNNPELDIKFVMWSLVANPFSEYAIKLSGRTRMPKLNRKQLFAFTFKYPLLDEQRRIVAYLDSVQTRLASLRELQSATGEELSALLPSVLDRAFRGEL